MDADRLARYTDRWVDFVNGLVIAVVTALIARTWLAGAVLLAVMVASALASTLGRRVAGRSAAAASTARARFGQSLVSALESVRTVKLAAATPQVHQHLRDVDGGRVDAAVREHRVQALLDGVPVVMVQCGVVAAWGGLLTGQWELATALLVANAVSGFDWFGRVAGTVVTEAPGTRAWMNATSELAGGGDLMDLPARRRPRPRHRAASPSTPHRDPLRTLTRPRPRRGARRRHASASRTSTSTCRPASWSCCSARSGRASPACSARSPASSAAPARSAGTTASSTTRRPRCGPAGSPTSRRCRGCCPARSPATSPSTTPTGRWCRRSRPPAWGATSRRPVAPTPLVGHRGVRLSGGQVQRLALARALATDADVLLADDVSSALDAATEIELWQALRARGTAVIGATSKAAALAQADRVVVLDAGRVVDDGPWHELSSRWAHLAG